jgi:hypothetical protein
LIARCECRGDRGDVLAEFGWAAHLNARAQAEEFGGRSFERFERKHHLDVAVVVGCGRHLAIERFTEGGVALGTDAVAHSMADADVCIKCVRSLSEVGNERRPRCGEIERRVRFVVVRSETGAADLVDAVGPGLSARSCHHVPCA